MQEIWKNIDGFEGYYEVSNFGNVRSLDRVVINKNNFKRKISGTILSLNTGHNGYYFCRLSKNGKHTCVRVNRLVARAFLPNPNNLPFVNHLDFNKKNNNIHNLQWISLEDNVHHSISRMYKNLNIDSNMVREIFILFHKHNESISGLMKKFRMKRWAVSNIIHRKSWKKFTEDLKFLTDKPDIFYKSIENQEIWKPINNNKILNGFEVSDRGRIKLDGKLRPQYKFQNYHIFCVKRKTFSVHRTVAQTFVPNPYNYKYVHHIDSNTDNNNAENLQWCTLSFNSKQSWIDASDRKNHPLNKLSQQSVLKIKELYSTSEYNLVELGNMFGVHSRTIRNIIRGKTWKHLLK